MKYEVNNMVMKKCVLVIFLVISNLLFCQNKTIGMLSTLVTDSNTRNELILASHDMFNLEFTEIKNGHCNISDGNKKTFPIWIKTLPIIDTLKTEIKVNYYLDTFNNSVDDIIHETIIISNFKINQARYITFTYVNNEFYSVVDQIGSL